MSRQVVALIRALGGRLAWRYWWPLVPMLAEALLVTTMGRGISEGPSTVTLLVSLATVPLVWLWGARFAIALGHSRARVYPVALSLSLVLPVVWQAMGVVLGTLSGQAGMAQAQGIFLLYGLPMVGLLTLGCCLWLGFTWLGAGIAVGSWVVAAGVLFFVLWPMLATMPVVQLVVATVAVTAILGACAWGGWQGFKVARA